MRTKTDNLELAVKMDVGKDVLLVSYSIENQSNSPLFLFNNLHGFPVEGVYEIDPGAYVEIADDQVVISKKQLSLPPGVMVESRNIPFVTRIPPGRSFKETFRLPVPLSRKVYYKDAESEEELKDRRWKNMKVMFQLGYFFGVPGTDELAVKLPTNRGEVLGFDPFPITSQRIISAGPFRGVPTYRPD